jgi:hypothetical protein
VIEVIPNINNGMDKTMSNAFDKLKLTNMLHIFNKEINRKIIPSTESNNP